MNLKKRVTIIILLVFVIICVGTYVSANNKKILNSEIKFLEKTDLIKAVTSTNIGQNKNIKINNEQINLEYKETRNNLNVYTDKNNTDEEYLFKDEKLIGFFKPTDISVIRSTDEKIDAESAKSIAKEFGEKNIEDFSKYEMISSNYINAYSQYNIRYMRKLKGFETRDVVEINVRSNGEIASFSAVNQGIFEKYEDYEIDTKVINDLCLEAIQNKYGEKVRRTQIEQQYLKILDGKLVVQTDIGVFLNDDILTEIYECQSLIYEID